MTWSLNSHDTKTDNDRFDLKIKLRREALQEAKLNNINVLDVFAGENHIWKKLGYDTYQGIEIEVGKGDNNIYGDNLKIIPNLNLSKYNIIDLDSYGIPFPQMELVLNSNQLQKGTLIIYTATNNSISNLNKSCIEYFGVEEIYKENKSMLNGYGLNMFYGMLYDKGVKKIKEYNIDKNYKKRYGYFII